MLTVKQPGAPDAGNLHVRCDEGRERTGGTDPPRLLYWFPTRLRTSAAPTTAIHPLAVVRLGGTSAR